MRKSLNREKVADKISDLFNPYYSSSPFFLLVAAGSSRGVKDALAYWLVLTFFFSALPMWDIKRRIKMGLVKDAHISRREDRIKPFLFSLACAVLGLVAVYAVDAPDAIRAVSWAVVLIGAAITAITVFWKISLHVSGITSIALILIILYGQIAIPLVLLVPVVAWARLILKKHTANQMAAGALIAIAIVTAVFARFGLL